MPQILEQDTRYIAAIDLGSNSFHMAIAQIEHGEIRIQERLGEKVQLAAGLDKQGNLDDSSIARALECLQRFEQRLRSIDREFIQIVGTNALRVARNRKKLTQAVEDFYATYLAVSKKFIGQSADGQAPSRTCFKKQKLNNL